MSSLQDRRVWIGGGAVAALLIAAFGWFFVISPELSSTTDLHTQADDVRSQNAVLAQKLTTLQRKSSKLGEYTASLRQALEALPSDSGLPAFTRQLSAQARAHNVTLTSVTVGGITSVTQVTPTTGTTDDPAATAAPTATPVATATPAPATAAAAPASGLYSVEVSVLSSGSLAHQLAFLHDVQLAGPRRALVTSTQFAPGTNSKVSSIDASTAMTSQLTVFSAPQSPAQVAELNKLLQGKIGN